MDRLLYAKRPVLGQEEVGEEEVFFGQEGRGKLLETTGEKAGRSDYVMEVLGRLKRAVDSKILPLR